MIWHCSVLLIALYVFGGFWLHITISKLIPLFSVYLSLYNWWTSPAGTWRSSYGWWITAASGSLSICCKWESTYQGRPLLFISWLLICFFQHILYETHFTIAGKQENTGEVCWKGSDRDISMSQWLVTKTTLCRLKESYWVQFPNSFVFLILGIY